MKALENKLDWREHFSKILKKYFYISNVEKGFYFIFQNEQMWEYSFNGKHIGSASGVEEAKQKCETEHNKNTGNSRKPEVGK